VSAKAVRNQMVPSRAEWRGETDNRATTLGGYCPSTASFSVRPTAILQARRDRCQEYRNCFPFGGLEETTRTSSNYVNEDYPARPEIKQSFTGWGDNWLRIVHSGDWCLRSVLRTSSGACHTRRRRIGDLLCLFCVYRFVCALLSMYMCI